jgi:hypothetical protein
MRRYLAYCLLALMAFVSCSREMKEEPVEYGGTVDLRFATGNLSRTKATTPGNGVVRDGGGLYMDAGNPDLVILIADNNVGSATRGDIVLRYPGPKATKTSSTATETVITFDFTALSAGNYIVYAFGNTQGLWTMNTSNIAGNDTIEISGSDLADPSKITKASQLDGLQFKPKSSCMIGWEDDGYAGQWDNGLEIQADRLPVSAKAPLTVSSRHNGESRLELLRCVAKVTAKIINNMDEPLNLYEYKHTVHGINPTTGYVLEHDNDFIGTAGNLLANPASRYGNPSLAIPIAAAPDGSQTYDFYVFPCKGPFEICIQFKLDPAGRTYTYKKLPVTNWRAEDIIELRRNQHLIVETRISQGVHVSFNFEVADWTEHSESVTFD